MPMGRRAALDRIEARLGSDRQRRARRAVAGTLACSLWLAVWTERRRLEARAGALSVPAGGPRARPRAHGRRGALRAGPAGVASPEMRHVAVAAQSQRFPAAFAQPVRETVRRAGSRDALAPRSAHHWRPIRDICSHTHRRGVTRRIERRRRSPRRSATGRTHTARIYSACAPRRSDRGGTVSCHTFGVRMAGGSFLLPRMKSAGCPRPPAGLDACKDADDPPAEGVVAEERLRCTPPGRRLGGAGRTLAEGRRASTLPDAPALGAGRASKRRHDRVSWHASR